MLNQDSDFQRFNQKVTHYRPSYRSVVGDLEGTHENIVLFNFEQEARPLDSEPHPDIYLKWAASFFTPWMQESFGHLKMPWLLVNGDVFMQRPMESLGINPKLVRDRGLLIFMYEPVFVFSEQGVWPWVKRDGEPRFPELESITAYSQKHDLEGRITVCLCEPGLAAELHSRGLFTELNLIDFSAYNIYEAHVGAQFKWPDSSDVVLNKKVISLNFRYESVRELLAGYLANSHLDDVHLSFYHKHNREELLARLPFDPEELAFWKKSKQGIDLMQDKLPLTLDVKKAAAVCPTTDMIPDFSGENLRDQDVLNHNFVKYAFAFAYCESRPFTWRSEISEKTFHPIFMRKVFLPYAAPHFLKNLRSLGFRTFGDYWDESYDEIIDDKLRFEKYIECLDGILDRSYVALNQKSRFLRPIYNHNFQHLTEVFIPQQTNFLREELEKL